jgi:hypothetical protein
MGPFSSACFSERYRRPFSSLTGTHQSVLGPFPSENEPHKASLSNFASQRNISTMVKTFRPQERQEIKAFLDSLLAGPAAVDSQAVEAAFWDRLRPLLAANDQSQGLVQLDVLGQAVLEGQPGAALDGPVLLLPPVAGVAARSQSPPRSSAKGKGKAKMPARRSSKRASASFPTTAVKKPRGRRPRLHHASRTLSVSWS